MSDSPLGQSRSAHPQADAQPKPGFVVRVLGATGSAVIAVTLFGARLWARVTRTPYYRD